MQFVELAPTWECSFKPDFTNAFSCVSDANKVSGDVNFCHIDSPFKLYHRRNQSNPLSLHNWIEDLDLACSK